MTDGAHLDFEWASPVDIRKGGTFRQMEHPAARVWCMSWRINRGPVNRWRPGYPDPVDLLNWVHEGRRTVAHNAAGAEWVAWNKFVRPNIAPHWPELKLEQLSCTMARCFVLGLPGSLELAGVVLNLAEQKDHDGGQLAKKMAMPRKVVDCWRCHGQGCANCYGVGKLYTWWDDEENIAKLMAYCDQDVETETALDAALPELPEREREIWLFDQQMNIRGVGLDVPLIEKAQRVVEIAKAELDARIAVVTGGAVTKVTQVKRIVDYVRSRGVPCDSVGKGDQEDIITLAHFIDAPDVEEVIELRRLAKASTSKLDAMMNCVNRDGSARRLQEYHAAHTGREGGRLIQPQNLHRYDEDRDGNIADCTVALLECLPVPAICKGLRLICGEPTDVIAKSMRRFFKARPGTRYVGGDLQNIEGCVNAWLPNEEWKIEAYRAFQRGDGPDLYQVAYASSFGGRPEDVRGHRRQVGKVQELAYGYQGSVGAFISMGAVYSVRPSMVCGVVKAAADPEDWESTCRLYERMPAPLKYGLGMDEWTAIKITVIKYRASVPKVEQGWYDQQDAAIAAVAAPGEIFPVFNGRIQYVARAGFLFCMLPTRRVLAYPKPRLVERDDSLIEFPNGSRMRVEDLTSEINVSYGAELTFDLIDGLLKLPGVKLIERRRQVVLYEGRRSGQFVWGSNSLYGGKQDENNVSGIARDVLFHGCLEARQRGYQCVMTVHDEQLTEMPFGVGSAKELQAIMEMEVPGCEGLPLKAKCWEDDRYSK